MEEIQFSVPLLFCLTFFAPQGHNVALIGWNLAPPPGVKEW